MQVERARVGILMEALTFQFNVAGVRFLDWAAFVGFLSWFSMML